MKIGLIDVDGSNFPNLCLMKLSSYHKRRGDDVEWYDAFEHYDKVYCSKVFSFTPDYQYPINADEVIKGGTGYAIHGAGGETYLKRDAPPANRNRAHNPRLHTLCKQISKHSIWILNTRVSERMRLLHRRKEGRNVQCCNCGLVRILEWREKYYTSRSKHPCMQGV